MAVFTVPNDIDNYVPLEGLPEFHGQLDALVDLFRTVSIDMEDRGTNSLGHFGAVESCTCLPGGGGESDLVIGNNMHSSFRFVAHQVLHLQGLIYHSLAGEGCVAMYHYA